MKGIKEIEKESLIDVKYPIKDIVSGTIQRLRRTHNLYTAMLLGNTFKRKVKIIFQTSYNKFFVHTTIWHVGKDYITLKGGRVLPIKSIEKVKFY